MVSSRVCYLTLFTCTIFYIKKLAFRSSNLPYDIEQSQSIRETFIYSSLWSYRLTNGTGLRTSRTSLIQVILLLSSDIETCPGPIDKCSSCFKALNKKQSRMSCSQRKFSPEMLLFRRQRSLVLNLVNTSITFKMELIEINKKMFIVMTTLNSASMSLKRALKLCIKTIEVFWQTKVTSAKSGVVLRIYTFFRSVKHIYPAKAKQGYTFIANQGILVKVEVSVFLFLHLFPFKDEWILKNRMLNTSGLKYYFLKPKVF